MSRVFKVDYIPDPDRGRPLWNAKIFVGVANQDPTIPSNQIQLTGDIGFPVGQSIPVPQPVRTNAGGITVYNNSPLDLNAPGQEYAIQIFDRNDNLIYNFPQVDGSVVMNTTSQEEVTGLTIWPEVGEAVIGQTIPAGTDAIRYPFNGRSTIFTIKPPVAVTGLITNITINSSGIGELEVDNSDVYDLAEFNSFIASNDGDSQLAGGNIWPLSSQDPLPLGAQASNVPSGISILRVITGSEVELLNVFDPNGDFSSTPQTITDILANSTGGYDVVTSTGTYEAFNDKIKELRGLNAYPTVVRECYPEGWGAVGDGVNDDDAAVQEAVLNLKLAGNNARKLVAKQTYLISSSIVWGSSLEMDGVGTGEFLMSTNDIPILTFTQNSQFFDIRDVTFRYVTTQTIRDGSCIQIAAAGVRTNSYKLKGVRCYNGYHGYYNPNEVESLTFLGLFENCWAFDCVEEGWYFYGDSTAATTNITLNQCWVLQTQGAEIATSKGFFFRNVQDLSLDNLACDHIQSDALTVTNCNGDIGTIAIESSERLASSVDGQWINMILSHMTFSHVQLVNNNVTLQNNRNFAVIRVQGGSFLQLNKIVDDATNLVNPGTGRYDMIAVNSTSDRAFNEYARSINGSPAPSVLDVTPRRIRKFNGQSTVYAYGNANVAAGGNIDTGLGERPVLIQVDQLSFQSDTPKTVRAEATETLSNGVFKVRYYNFSDNNENFGTFNVQWEARLAE